MQKICALVEGLVGRTNGECQTRIPGVRIYRQEKSSPRMPVLYRAGLVLICQGHKVGYFQGQELQYNPNNYLVMAAPLPMECQTFATPEEPLLAVVVDIDIALLQHIWSQLDQHTLTEGLKTAHQAHVAEAIPQTPSMQQTLERLLVCAQRDETAKIFGQDLVKELYYHALKGSHASALLALADRHSPFTRIAETLNYIELHLSQSLTVQQLADMNGMSVPTFHRLFKEVSGESPLQFLKKNRLSRAKDLIQNHGMKANMAAQAVGYESSSQFSREFKRFFGTTPMQDKTPSVLDF